MEIKIQAIHFEATEKLEKFIEKKLAKLAKFNDEIGSKKQSIKQWNLCCGKLPNIKKSKKIVKKTTKLFAGSKIMCNFAAD